MLKLTAPRCEETRGRAMIPWRARSALVFALAAALAAAAGCSAGPEPRGPAGSPDAAPAIVRPAVAAAPAAPLTLDAATALALERNPDLRGAAERIGEAEARLRESRAAFLPQIVGRVSYARTDNALQAFGMIVAQRRFSPELDVNDPGVTETWRPEIAAGLSLFRGGQDWARQGAAKLGVEASRLEREALRNGLVDAVAAAYYGALAAEAQGEVARASVAAVASELAAARARVEAGASLLSDALSLEVRLAAASEGEVRAGNGVELARAALRALLVLPADAPVELAPAGRMEEGSVPASFAQAHERALAERPEIAAAGRLVAIREREVAAERGAHLPRVSAYAAYGQDARDLELSRHQDSWTVGAAVEVDVFSGFATTARVAGSEHRHAEARAAAEAVRLEVERDVRSSFVGLDDARRRERVAAGAVPAAEEALRLVREQVASGAATVTRYLEAEAALADARSRAIAARYDARRAEAALVRAMGGWR